jgi:hypothetical protein
MRLRRKCVAGGDHRGGLRVGARVKQSESG